MTQLTSHQLLKDSKSRDPNAVLLLKLNHRAVSDVSCLSDFKKLEKLDLTFNKLTSLEGLQSCINLKWLSVGNNKLESLKGIESFTKLTVLNAGNNKLKSMDAVKSIASLRALILNDNEISSICKLDQMKDLNTLVLSKNPISEIGKSLVKAKSIRKLSLSYCRLQNINSSLKSCVELKELRLSHNDIKSLPAELAHNKYLQNLDVGNNVITRWSDLKVLKSLVNLKNLNLQGNPIAEKDKYMKKIRTVLPNLRVFNTRPTNKYSKDGKSDIVDNNGTAITADNKLETEKVDNLDGNCDVDMKNELKDKRQKTSSNLLENEFPVDEEDNRNQLKKKKSKDHVSDQSKIDNRGNDVDLEKELRQRDGKKNDKLQNKEGLFQDKDDTKVKKKLKENLNAKRENLNAKRGELDVIDDGEASFLELFSLNNAEDTDHSGKKRANDKASQVANSVGGVVTIPAKRKKAKILGPDSMRQLSPAFEIGMGGPSTWGDE
ncbi:hypothetical protein FNV43_RR17717 [Rhamnella rubrinervis]|uniref:Protein phosphatase 1 regulatory subunit 7 n=1 Tax=Rhamnella rubrinervis TaxID=2594499 RepID=A0A8K0E4A4_9ROSA|nr:hypothetical protein FNV43_RR17717 [Rhamnella rubrinervis]